jgi:hypothetical protein
MRWTGWIFVVAVLGLAGSAAGFQPGCASCNQGRTTGPWDAEACAAPAGFALVPGCFEEHRHCCDNAWDGYCEHRAKVDACWYRLGTPAAYARCRPCRQAFPQGCTSCEPCSTPMMQATPTPAAPVPAPNKNSRNVYNNRLW